MAARAVAGKRGRSSEWRQRGRGVRDRGGTLKFGPTIDGSQETTIT